MKLKLLGTLLSFLSLTACAGQEQTVEQGGDFQPDSRPMATTLVYECAGAEFITRLGPGEMALWFEDRYLVLSQVRSASGTRYQEGEVQFWSKGEEAMLEIDGVRYSDCHLNHARAPWEDARRRGVEFRAVGNEPGWHLEVRGEQNLLFVGDYGSKRLLFEKLDTSEVEGMLHYRAEQSGNSIHVIVSETFCTDTMKGEEFPYTVVVQLNGEQHTGCGRALDFPWD